MSVRSLRVCFGLLGYNSRGNLIPNAFSLDVAYWLWRADSTNHGGTRCMAWSNIGTVVEMRLPLCWLPQNRTTSDKCDTIDNAVIGMDGVPNVKCVSIALCSVTAGVMKLFT
jgi:hypothetical protein